MKRLIVLIISLSLLVGCTAPTQPIADQAMSVGIAQAHSIVMDLIRLQMQRIGDSAIQSVRGAASSQDPDAAQAIVVSVMTDVQKVQYLQQQHERARALMRIGQQYIWEQKGIVNILIDEFQEAKEKVDGSH